MGRTVLSLLLVLLWASPALAQNGVQYSAEQAQRLRAAMTQFVVIAPTDLRSGKSLTQRIPTQNGSRERVAMYLDPEKCAADMRDAGGAEVMAGVPGSAAEAIVGTGGEIAWLASESDAFGVKVFYLANERGQELTIDVNGRPVVPFYASEAEAIAMQQTAQQALGASANIKVETYRLELLIERIINGEMSNAHLVSSQAMAAWVDAYNRGVRLIGKDWPIAGAAN
jgi:hypothetical protein